jgi:hypothetical protein
MYPLRLMLPCHCMKTLKSKYSQGNLKNRWKIQQCRSEKLYFDYHKDCEHCEARAYCHSEDVQPYYINIASSMLIFADSFENAKEYAGKGHGWLLDKEIISGLPVDVEVVGDSITFKSCDE